MGGISQLEFEKGSVNPPEEHFKESLRVTSGLKILDIGSGNRLSVSLKKGDLYVMVDPNLDPHGSISSGLNRREPGSQVFGFTCEVADVPPFKPDLTLMIAPNPVDILENDLLDDSEEFLEASQAVLVVLDMRTIEATINPQTLRPDNSGLRQAKERVQMKLESLGFEVKTRRGAADRIGSLLEEVGIQRSGVLNSGDLGAEKIVIMGSKGEPLEDAI